MTSRVADCVVSLIEAEVSRRPSAMEFELAYQARVAIDCIRFAIKVMEQFARQPDQLESANFQLLDALDRLESAERNFQRRFRSSHANTNSELRYQGVNGASIGNGVSEASSRGAKGEQK